LGIKLINWSSDDSWRFDQHSKILSKYFDIMITTSSDAHSYYKNNGIKSILASWGCPDDWLGEAKKFKNCKRDIIFIGQCYFDREKIIRLLRKRFKVDCYGNGWENKPLRDDQVSDFLRDSKISLNFSKSRGKKNQTKARVFEICGSGGFCITESSQELRGFYSNSEVISFKDTEELIKKIEKYLYNGELRDQICLKANKKSKKYSYSKIQKRIISKIEQFKLNEKYNINFKKNFHDFLLKNILIFFIKFFFNLLMVFLSKQLTTKIVRRFFFELEWRLRREKTYSKSGACNNFFKSF
jgi:hypothetical protein